MADATMPSPVPPGGNLYSDPIYALVYQGMIDNQTHARAMNAIQLRRAENAATVDHLADLAAGTTDQTGQTENQQNTSPVGQALGESLKGGVGVAAESVPTILAQQIATALAALLPASITAAQPAPKS